MARPTTAQKENKAPRNRLRDIWYGMIARCHDEEDARYARYGARGITVCDEWHDYDVFRRWAETHGYEDAFGAKDSTSSDMRAAIEEWFTLYYNREATKDSDPCQRIAYTIVNKLTKTAFGEYSATCEDEFAKTVLAALGSRKRKAMQLSLIGGEAWIKPFPAANGKFAFSVIPRNNVLVFGRDAEGTPTDIGTAERTIQGNSYYTLLERRTVDAQGLLTLRTSSAIAASVQGQEDLADAVKDTTKAQQKSVAGFDEITQLAQDAADATGSMGAIGGLDAGAMSIPEMETPEMEEPEFESWGEAFDRFLDAVIDNGIPRLRGGLESFTGWLNGFSGKVYDMLTFPGVADKMETVGDDLAGAANNMVLKVDWYKLGGALGAGLNLALHGCHLYGRCGQRGVHQFRLRQGRLRHCPVDTLESEKGSAGVCEGDRKVNWRPENAAGISAG